MPNQVYARPNGRQWVDFDPRASELWVVAAPAWRSPGSIDPQHLPSDCRFVSDQEWAAKDDPTPPLRSQAVADHIRAIENTMPRCDGCGE